MCHKSAAGFPWKSVDGSQALEKFLVFRLFADRVNVGGDDPNRHPAFCAGNQQVDNQFMMRRLLPGKGKKAGNARYFDTKGKVYPFGYNEKSVYSRFPLPTPYPFGLPADYQPKRQ